MKPYVCKHGHRVGFFSPVKSREDDKAITYNLVWHYCGACCEEIAAHQIAVAVTKSHGQRE